MIWYVATVDEPAVAFGSRERAVNHILASHQDSRARPKFKRIGFRLFEYQPPRDPSRVRQVTYYLGDRRSMEVQGFFADSDD